MAEVSLKEAKQLCTAAELKLFRLSWPRSAMGLNMTQLRANIARVRKMRDKFRDLARRQRLEARGKRAASGRRPAQGNERTLRKAELFSQILDRFQTRLAALDEPKTKRTVVSGRKDTKQRAAARKAKDTQTAISRRKSAKQKNTPLEAAPKAPPKPAPATAGDGAGGVVKKTARTGRKGARFVPDKTQRKKNLRRKVSSTKTASARKANRIARSGSRKIAAHVSARGRRRQARRDTRR